MKEWELSSDALLLLVRTAVAQGRGAVITGTGDSMLPLIRPDRDRVVLSPLPQRGLLPGDVVLYERGDGHAVIHRICRVRPDSFDLLGDHQVYIDRRVAPERIVALATKIIRPDGTEFLTDTDAERARACREMRLRMRRYLLHHYAARLRQRFQG